MPERPTLEAQSPKTLARPRLILSWRLDPATRKPVARWTVEQPAPPANFAMPAAA